MVFPDSTRKAEQYDISGQMLANVAGELSGIDPSTFSSDWSATMVKLATADDISEDHPEYFESGAGLLRYLELNPLQGALVRSADGLLAANIASSTATTIRGHFSARRREALHSVGLLRHQSPEDLRVNDYLWSQLGSLAVVGIHLDSFIDARKDSVKLPQFSAQQLAYGSMTELLRTARQIDGGTFAAILRQTHAFGFDAYMAKKLVKPLLRTKPALTAV